MRRLLTIHGVGFLGERGPWQDVIERVMGPHFHCENIKYSHYRWLGLVAVVIEPWAVIVGSVAIATAWILGIVKPSWILVALAAVVTLIAFLLPPIRRNHAIRTLEEKTGSSLFRQRPHVIAHSMGTQLVGSALAKKSSAFFCSRVILAGCVLPVYYSWKASERLGFEHVRNEVGQDDWVPIVAAVLSKFWILRGFGAAGTKGFQLVKGLVHSVADAYSSCAECTFQSCLPSVHNFFCAFGHKGALTEHHAARVLLPWLWGIESGEYQLWIECCIAAREHLIEENWPKLAMAERLLLSKRWTWIQALQDDALNPTPARRKNPESLREYISRLLNSHPHRESHNPEAIARVLQAIYISVANASEAYHNRKDEWRYDILSLQPALAVVRAVKKYYT